MKVKFAKEKSAYSHALHMYMSEFADEDARNAAWKEMKQIKESIKQKDDEILIIITTKKTWKGKSAPPMSEADIKA